MPVRTGICLPALTVLLGAAGATPAVVGAATQAADQAGFYVGVMGGASSFHSVQKAVFDAAANNAWGNVTDFGTPSLFTATTASSSLENLKFAFGGLVGFRFASFFSIEAGYMDLGQQRYK